MLDILYEADAIFVRAVRHFENWSDCVQRQIDVKGEGVSQKMRKNEWNGKKKQQLMFK